MPARPQSLRPYQASFFDVPEALVCTAGFDGRLMRVGVGWESGLGHSADTMLSRPFTDFVHPDDLAATLGAFAALTEGVKVASFQNRYRAADGDYRWLRWNAVADMDTETIYALANDVSDTKQFEDEVARRSLRDELTELPNRVLFIDRVDNSLAQLARRSSHVAVLLLDIDEFHVLNDTLGRRVGDEVLVEIARRLGHAVRASDTVARVGSDEFAVLCTDIDETAVLEVAERVAAEISAPLDVRGRSLVLTASTGVAVAHTARAGEMLVADADVALHRANSDGGGRIEFFDRALRTESAARMELQLALRAAIQEGELTLVYQPVVDLRTNEAVAFEALVRWRHPERGLLSPAVFIPLAEETGLINSLGAWVLQAACREAARWPRARGASSPAVAVNVSARQLADPDLVCTVARALESARLDPARLCLEVTETAVLADLEASVEILTTLQGLGIRIALDDFGEGQSSLSQLNLLAPVSVLKIGAAFVAQVHQPGSRAGAVVEAMLRLGHAIGLQTVAEGVETPAQLSALRAMGCSAAQGYILARPQPAGMIDRWLEPSAFAGAG